MSGMACKRNMLAVCAGARSSNADYEGSKSCHANDSRSSRQGTVSFLPFLLSVLPFNASAWHGSTETDSFEADAGICCISVAHVCVAIGGHPLLPFAVVYAIGTGKV